MCSPCRTHKRENAKQLLPIRLLFQNNRLVTLGNPQLLFTLVPAHIVLQVLDHQWIKSQQSQKEANVNAILCITE